MESVEFIYKRKFKPELAIDLLTKLMNSMIVLVMNGTKHGSIKALDGYISFHRLLMALVEEFPELKKSVETKIETFISEPNSRRKQTLSSIGDFLPLLTVSEKFSWKDVALPVIQETLVTKFPSNLGEKLFLGEIAL
jgi:hypothetical protein